MENCEGREKEGMEEEEKERVRNKRLKCQRYWVIYIN